MGARDEAMKLLEQESAKMAAGGEQMDVSDVKKVVRRAERAVSGNVFEEVDGIIKKLPFTCKQHGKCDEFAKKLAEQLDLAGIDYEIIRVESIKYIYSDKYGGTVGYKFHYGIKIQDMIYDNLTLKGMEFNLWEKDLGKGIWPPEHIRDFVVDSI